MGESMTDVRGRVLVTGATGFVGRACVDGLLRRGYAVRRVLRVPSAPLADVEDVVVGDLVDVVDWSGVMQGIDVVVHLAARVHVMRETVADPRAAFYRINVDATRRLAEGAARAGVRRFVFLSSVKVQGECSRGRPLTERDPPAPEGSYGESKRDAEVMLADIMATTGLEVVMLRSPLVYGPGVGGNVQTLMRAVERGLPLPFGAVDNRRSFIAVRNLVDAIVCVCATDRRLRSTYVVSDGIVFSTPQLIRLLAEGIGRPPRLVSVPVPWLKVLAGWIGQRDAMQRLLGSFEIDDAAFRHDLGWHPPVAPGPELVATGRWFAGRA
jgi:nucleoside-diphosphate-sugar epimerase